MSTAELIADRSTQLSAQRQAEVLDFVEFLLAREGHASADADWSAFAAAELARSYHSADDVYDQP